MGKATTWHTLFNTICILNCNVINLIWVCYNINYSIELSHPVLGKKPWCLVFLLLALIFWSPLFVSQINGFLVMIIFAKIWTDRCVREVPHWYWKPLIQAWWHFLSFLGGPGPRGEIFVRECAEQDWVYVICGVGPLYPLKLVVRNKLSSYVIIGTVYSWMYGSFSYQDREKWKTLCPPWVYFT